MMSPAGDCMQVASVICFSLSPLSLLVG